MAPPLLRFLLLRLKHASFAELSYRMRQKARSARIRSARPYAPARHGSPVSLSGLAVPVMEPEVSLARVEAVLAGERYTLNTGARTLDRWQAALAGTRGGMRGDADLRVVWEPARLQHLTVLFAYLARKPRESADRVREFARSELLGWLDANPFPQGPNYRSAMECALRIPVFFYALKLLPELQPAESARIAAALHAHAEWIEANLSLYSSLGNHTVCEAAGLVFAGGVFRDHDRGRRWLARGVGLLGQELVRQVLPDGGALEQSLSYHRFVLDVYWLTAGFLEGSGLRDCGDWRRRLRFGEEFLSGFALPGAGYPSIGDADDGCAVAPGLSPLREPPFPHDAACRVFPDAGYTVVGTASGGRITFDHGPLGMPPLYNHGHADALSITLSVRGVELLVDPGTYRYNGAPGWRRYFKGTSAHNTVTVDGLDQAVQQTGFIWSSPYACRLLAREEGPAGCRVEAEHDGYLRLKEPLSHRRTLAVHGDGAVVTDRFHGSGEHEFDLHLHLHPFAVVSREGGSWYVSRGGSRISLSLLGGDDFELLQGGEGGHLGWHSPRYGVKLPSAVLRCRRKGSCAAVSFQTVIGWGAPPDRLP